ncbi:unnamed protein product, partial [Symbiodinium sp. CCMP2456]
MGGQRNPARAAQVRVLSSLARQHGLETLNDAAARAKVEKLSGDLLNLQLSDEERQQVVEATTAFQATYPDVQPQVVQNPVDNKVWKFSAVQLTYNCSQGEWTSHEEDVLRRLFNRFVGFLIGLSEALHALGTSATMERASPRQVHMHAYLHLGKSFHRRGREALDVFSFEGVKPHLTPNTASGKSYMGAVRYGHFYVVVNKIGTIFNYTDFGPFKAYGVEGWWLDNLLKSGKLTRETYLHLAARVTVGFQKRLADCRAAERYLQEESLRAEVSAQQHALEPAMLPMKVYPQVEDFIQLHDGQANFRRPILAIVGGTRLGKSVLAGDVLRRIGERLNLPDFLEITVEDSEQMDLAEFDRRIHSGVILDGVGDAVFLKRHRETLQGRPKVVKGAKSATNVYAYSFSFCARAVVATFDLSARNLTLLETDHWLSNRENVILLELNEPVYSTAQIGAGPFPVDEGDATPAASRPPKRRWLGSPARNVLTVKSRARSYGYDCAAGAGPNEGEDETTTNCKSLGRFDEDGPPRLTRASLQE